MGWLPVFAVMFMIAAGVAIDGFSVRRSEADYDHAAVLASQMAVWHNTLVQHCKQQVTPPECQSPQALSPTAAQLRDGFGNYSGQEIDPADLVKMGFKSAVDPVSHVIVTIFDPPTGRNRAFAGQVVTALTVAQGWNVMSGFYDLPNRRVDRAKILSMDNPMLGRLSVPTNIGTLSIPDNAPIIVTTFY